MERQWSFFLSAIPSWSHPDRPLLIPQFDIVFIGNVKRYRGEGGGVGDDSRPRNESEFILGEKCHGPLDVVSTPSGTRPAR